jgi:hypothetical protein
MQKLKASRVRIKENCQTPTDLFLQGGARLRAGSPFRHAPLTNKEAGGYYVRAGWSSLVARRAHNPEVVGSNPSPAIPPNQAFFVVSVFQGERLTANLTATGRA